MFPIHPRTIKCAKEFELYERLLGNPQLISTEPLDYFAFQKLIKTCAFIITDSGGIQEESTFRKKPCLTIRPNTERPVTLKEHGGASVLVGNNVQRITEEFEAALKKKRTPHRPELWDGKTAERCLMEIVNY